jgi:hypothetical protein
MVHPISIKSEVGALKSTPDATTGRCHLLTLRPSISMAQFRFLFDAESFPIALLRFETETQNFTDTMPAYQYEWQKHHENVLLLSFNSSTTENLTGKIIELSLERARKAWLWSVIIRLGKAETL